MKAQLALGLATSDVIGPIVQLLRSAAPIDPIVRKALADAFEGKRPGGAPHFIVRETGRADYSGKSLAKFRRDVAIARFVADWRLRHPRDKTGAIEAAAIKFKMSEKTCDAAVTKTVKMDAWLAANFADDERVGALAALPDSAWQRFREGHYWAKLICKSKV